MSYRINTELNKKIKELGGDEQYHIAGVPVAEVAVGVEMFSQMSVGSPLAMAVIFGLMLLFFRKWRLVILPMIIAMFSVIGTMGLMIALGFQVHILSSMIPIFLMCIGTVSSIHILSEFFDVYTKEKGRKETIKEVMDTLFTPILYTSLTTAAGFASLTFAPIPPAQIFGSFLKVGVMIAWLYTVIFVPAYIMMIPDRKLVNFGMSARKNEDQSLMTKILKSMDNLTKNHAKLVIIFIAIASGIALWGTTKINVNDNYAKRFVNSYPIRKADIALNKYMDGTYTAYLILEDGKESKQDTSDNKALLSKLISFAKEIASRFPSALDLAQDICNKAEVINLKTKPKNSLINEMIGLIDKNSEGVSDEIFFTYEELQT